MSRRKKLGYEKTSFAFAAMLQRIAEERSDVITVDSFKVEPARKSSGSYDKLVVTFLVPRPDEDKERDPLEQAISDVEASIKDLEVLNDEI